MLVLLFFCLYINDLQLHLPPGTLHLLNADDLQAYIQVLPEIALPAIETLTLVACTISDWNHKKTKAIFFSILAFVENLNYVDLEFDIGKGIKIPFSEEVKSLVKYMENKLNFFSQLCVNLL